MRFHFIDVGHGDAILIEEEGQGISLVDAGKPEYGETVWHYLQDLGIQRIEQLYVTHTHVDHVGGIPTILDNMDVGAIYHTGMMHDWKAPRSSLSI
ncbi:MBL fold metallo-hydrolase [bacterium]|nr:MBL fold metallo-hydrolase [bacterium]